MEIDEYFVKEAPAYIYHYTSMDGLKNILKTHSLWFSEYSFLNDYSERVALYQKLFKTIYYDNELSDWMKNDFKIDIGGFPVPLIDVLRERTSSDEQQYFPYHYFICSFSNDPDNLHLWSSYTKSNDLTGYSIAFQYFYLSRFMAAQAKKHRCFFSTGDINYDLDAGCNELVNIIREQHAEWEKSDEKGKEHISRELIKFLDLRCLYYKNACFSIENEVRFILIMDDSVFKESLKLDENTKDLFAIKIREKKQMFIPYVEFGFSYDKDLYPAPFDEYNTFTEENYKDFSRLLISEIKVSPTLNNLKAINSINYLLDKYDYIVDDLTTSDIPLDY